MRRRHFLAISAGGAALLVVGGIGVALQGTVLREARRGLQVLDPRSFSVLAAVADRLCPGGGALPSAWELEVPEAIDAFLATAHPGVGTELIQGLAFVENALPGLLLDRQPRPFTARSAEDQDRTLHGMAHSRIGLRRTIYKALLGLVSATYWGHAATFAHSGYRPVDYSGLIPVPEPVSEEEREP